MAQFAFLPLAGKTDAFALVDADMLSILAYRRKWYLHPGGYAISSAGGPGLMHRFVLGVGKGDTDVVDHINGNRLDNRRRNLRALASASENHQNRRALRGYRGVSLDRGTGKWVAKASKDGERHYLGLYDDEVSAAQAVARWRQEHLPFTVENVALLGGER